jgi:hypothetical protein
MTARRLLACFAFAVLSGGPALGQQPQPQHQDEDSGTCWQWGGEGSADAKTGVRLGGRLGVLKVSGGWPSDEVRLYDKLDYQLLRFDAGMIVQTIRCDQGEPLVVGRGVGGGKEYDIGIASWQARETRALARDTGTLVGTAQRENLLYLWSIKEIRPVDGSAATDYLVYERWCLLDRPAAVGGTRCSMVGWSTMTVRSLVNPLPING